MLKEVRNADGKLVAQINETAREVIIVQRGCATILCLNEDGTISVTNIKETAA